MAGSCSRRPGGARWWAGGGVVKRNYPVDFFRGERGKVGDQGGDGGREDGGSGKRGANVLQLLDKVGDKKSSAVREEGRREGTGKEGIINKK